MGKVNSLMECRECKDAWKPNMESNIIWNPFFEEDFYADLYDRILQIDEDEFVKKFEENLNFEDSSSKLCLLFLGCGTGRIEVPLLKALKNPVEVHIVDINKEFLKKCYERIKKINRIQRIEVIVHQTTIEKFWEVHYDKKFDIITAFFVLYLSPRWHDWVYCILSKLKSNGWFLLAEEIGDFAGKDNESSSTTERKKFLELREFIKDKIGNPFDLHSAVTLGILRENFRRLEKAGFIELKNYEIMWENSQVSFKEYLDVMTGKKKVLASSLYYPVKLRKAIWENFNKDWSNNNNSIPRREGHRIWIIRLLEESIRVAYSFLYCHYILLEQIDHFMLRRSY